jgi:cytochrome c oxidase subunit 2
MGILVFADPPARFRSWLANERKPASAAGRAGAKIFENGSCSACHAIRGTSANGDTGPDLTHLADRKTLGSVTIENTRQNLSNWIKESQHIKPGNEMPNINLRGDRLDAVVSYLESLK